jgi:hypothetical protein
MKTSLPPMPVLPPVAPVAPVAATPAVVRTAFPAQARPEDEARAGDPPDPPRAAVAFRAPRSGPGRGSPPPKLAHKGPVPVKPRPSGPAAAPVSTNIEVSTQNPGPDMGDEVDDDFDDRRARLGYSLRSNASQGGGGERSGTDEGGHRERLFKSIQLAHVLGVAGSGPAPAVEQALQSLLTARSIEALARPLRSLVRDIDALGGPAPLQSLVFRTARSWLERQATAAPAASGGTTTLGAIRAALVEGGEPARDAVSEQQAIANLWLPMYLLSLDRPRTPRQRQQAIERLDMIERRLQASTQRREG